MEIHTILYRYILGDATAEEKREVLLWLEEDKTHVQEYLSMRKLHDLNTWNTEKQPEKTTGKKKQYSLRKISLEFLKIASVLLIGILATYFLTDKEPAPAQTQTIYVPAGQRTELFLSDGTKVWLNSGTTITFPGSFTKKSREVTIDGEAYFDVEKDKEKPFIVHTEQHDIKVLGTEFNVKAYKGKNLFETALLQGSIEVSSLANGKAHLLKENETLSFRDEKTTKGTIYDYNYFKWRDGLICFEKESLASLFEKLELYYDIQIINNNNSLLKGSYTGKFRIRDGIEHVLKVLQLKHRFTYKKDEETNTITIE